MTYNKSERFFLEIPIKQVSYEKQFISWDCFLGGQSGFFLLKEHEISIVLTCGGKGGGGVTGIG